MRSSFKTDKMWPLEGGKRFSSLPSKANVHRLKAMVIQLSNPYLPVKADFSWGW
jgi:hypothetical protein